MTAVDIGNVAGATKTIRVGAGGVMRPNHLPFVIAETFGTLATLYPNRIDLGLGRAPRTDISTVRALRRHMAPEDSFPHDVLELINYFGEAEASACVRAIPGEGTHVPIWILGLSPYGAQLAAHYGLPHAFVSHFTPTMLLQALKVYRRTFRPAVHLARLLAMMASGVHVGETDAEAANLRCLRSWLRCLSLLSEHPQQ